MQLHLSTLPIWLLLLVMTPNVMSPAQRIDGAAATPYRLTFIATPCFLFQQFNDANKPGTAGTGYEGSWYDEPYP